MSVIKTERCPLCQAVVNPAWETCMACHRLLNTSEIAMEPAAVNARPIYWERADLSIAGPATPEFLAKVGTGPKASFWVVAVYNGSPWWIRADTLRSRQDWEQASKVVDMTGLQVTLPRPSPMPPSRKQKQETKRHLFPPQGNT